MPTTTNQRAKLLYLMKILQEKTDEDHPMTISRIIAELSAYGIQAERKSLYTDLEHLKNFGLDIETRRTKTTAYYIASRQFELPELKLLVDAVLSCRFITKKKSDELITKLSSLTSSEQAKHLRREIYIADRAKSINETIYYSIDKIHQAVNESKKISFKYFDYDVRKNRIYRKKGQYYVTTPVTLCWREDKYYLIAYSAKYDSLVHYRIDRMSNVDAMNDPADKYSKRKFNISQHVKSVFGMYKGETVRATLAFDNSLVNAVLDHFGPDAPIRPGSDGWFEVTADVSVSPVFLSWMFSFAGRAKIISPDSLIQAMITQVDNTSKTYHKK